MNGNQPLESFFFFIQYIDDKKNLGFDYEANRSYLMQRWEIPVIDLRPFIKRSFEIHGKDSRLVQVVITVASTFSQATSL